MTEELRTKYKIPPAEFRIFTNNPHETDPTYKGTLIGSKWWGHDYLNADCTPPERLLHDQRQLPQFRELHEILLSIGGYETCFPDFEEDMRAILERAYFRKGTSRVVKGQANHCHANAAYIYWENRKKEDLRICTGYALSMDGIWRQHSWVLRTYRNRTQLRQQVIETTQKRVAYFGFELTEEEAERFCYYND